MPQAVEAGGWGLLAGSALLIGAALGFWAPIPRRLTGAVMAFGAGVLISALSFELMDEAYRTGGLAAAASGFLAGAALFSAANAYLARRGAKHRKRSQGRQPSEAEVSGSGLAIAAGALLDGIPESVAIGLSLTGGEAVSLATVVAVFLSNVPEGLSSAAGMRAARRPAGYVFGVWGAVAAASALAAVLGFTAFGGLPPEAEAAVTALAAGGILAMLADTMIPEAFEEVHGLTGVATVLGFLLAFALSKLAGG